MPLETIARRLIVEPAVAPSASLAYGVECNGAWSFGSGAAGIRSATRPEPVSTDTLYDLASVTKPFIACLFARLSRAGRLDPNSPLEAVVEEARGTPSGALPLELFLAHRAGLGAHRELFAPLRDGRPVDAGRMLAEALHARRPECTGAPPPGGFPPLYSDLGYLLLGVALERAGGAPLDELVSAEVSGPLSLDVASARQWKRRDAARLARAAPTEVVEFRGGELVGVVHDENAWAFTREGLSGQAGLFGTAASVARFGAALVTALRGDSEGWLMQDDVERLVRPRPGGSLRAGFDGKSEEGSSAGSLAGPRTFGHLGFTGTSLWCDPDARVVVVALTNRVSPTREHTAIRQARPGLHDALFRAALVERERRAPGRGPGPSRGSGTPTG